MTFGKQKANFTSVRYLPCFNQRINQRIYCFKNYNLRINTFLSFQKTFIKQKQTAKMELMSDLFKIIKNFFF